jgi:hypothetical protein
MRIGLVWSHCLLQLLVESAEIISVKFRLRVTTVVLCATVSILLCVYLIFMQRCVSTRNAQPSRAALRRALLVLIPHACEPPLRNAPVKRQLPSALIERRRLSTGSTDCRLPRVHALRAVGGARSCREALCWPSHAAQCALHAARTLVESRHSAHIRLAAAAIEKRSSR